MKTFEYQRKRHTSTPFISSDVLSNPIAIDLGSSYIRAGFATESEFVEFKNDLHTRDKKTVYIGSGHGYNSTHSKQAFDLNTGLLQNIDCLVN